MIADTGPAIMMQKVLMKEEADYIENVLQCCAEDLDIKTYTVLREASFDSLSDQMEAIISHNPMMELAAQPLNMRFLNIDKWIAVLVEYEEK